MTRQPNAPNRPATARTVRGQPIGRAGAAPAELLEAIVVDDRDEVVEIVSRRHHRGLPDLALLALTVTEQHERPHVTPGQARPERDPKADGQAHPE